MRSSGFWDTGEEGALCAVALVAVLSWRSGGCGLLRSDPEMEGMPEGLRLRRLARI